MKKLTIKEFEELRKIYPNIKVFTHPLIPKGSAYFYTAEESPIVNVEEFIVNTSDNVYSYFKEIIQK
jgi:hypothetical protein